MEIFTLRKAWLSLIACYLTPLWWCIFCIAPILNWLALFASFLIRFFTSYLCEYCIPGELFLCTCNRWTTSDYRLPFQCSFSRQQPIDTWRLTQWVNCQLLAALHVRAMCLEYTAGLWVLARTTYSASLTLPSSWHSRPSLKRSVESTVCFVFFLLVVFFVQFMSLTQSRGWGSAMGMVCRTSSSSCRARCKWISIQQGVSLMLCRG